eukprot:scaffold17958_cov47-Prasinocladus_malaysianus.AAC.1
MPHTRILVLVSLCSGWWRSRNVRREGSEIRLPAVRTRSVIPGSAVHGTILYDLVTHTTCAG